jgi:hypothetical protein
VTGYWWRQFRVLLVYVCTSAQDTMCFGLFTLHQASTL